MGQVERDTTLYLRVRNKGKVHSNPDTSINSLSNDIQFVGVSFVLQKLSGGGGGGAPHPSLILQKCVYKIKFLISES